MYLLKLTPEGSSKNKFPLCRGDFSITLMLCGILGYNDIPMTGKFPKGCLENCKKVR